MNAPAAIPPMYMHQQYTADFIGAPRPGVIITSDAGTGKTRSVLEGFNQLRAQGAGRMLVLAPLSILKAAWVNDAATWTPNLRCEVSVAGSDAKRKNAFRSGAQIVVTNHDAVKWLEKNADVLDDFDVLCIDEFTAYKNRTSQRSKAIFNLRKRFKFRIIMCATPTPKTVLDMWHPAYIVDDGERLGKQYSAFRYQVCSPIQRGPDPNMVEWVDKPGAQEAVADRLRDITVRFKFEDCIDIPENTERFVRTELSPQLMKLYRQLEDEMVIEAASGAVVNAVHAGSKVQKLLQLCSGAVYDEEHVARTFHIERYQLVMDLVAERDHSVVAFNWKHQREELTRLAESMGISYTVIDGSVPADKRPQIVADYQAGKYQVIFAHPQSAGHGLTLTRGCATIWASPTYNAEWFQQFNARIYRAGQKRKTETILIAADGTHETKVYEKLQGKVGRMNDLLTIFAETTK